MNSVQQYCRGIIDGLQIPGIPQPLIAHTIPDAVENLDGPIAIVQASRMRGKRQTAPRISSAPSPTTAGFKRLDWYVDVHLAYETNADTQTVDQEFAVIADAIMLAYWTTAMPWYIEDLTTGLQTQILQIGEEFDLETPPARAPATLRMLYFRGRLGLSIYEAVQA